jgi:Ni,Fe-hydrogenase III large subunit
MALESVAQCEIAPGAQWLRALLLERERVANHLSDLGALGNDAGFAFGLSQFSLLRETWLRLNQQLFKHRLMMDCIEPGGVRAEVTPAMLDALLRQFDEIEAQVLLLQHIYEEHAGLQDRFIRAGIVTPQRAAQLGLCGLAGRASGLAVDLRADQPQSPYDRLEVRMATHRNGDVAARVIVRFEEIIESLRLMRTICAQLALIKPQPNRQLSHPHGSGIGWVEGWRGEVLIALDIRAGKIRRCHAHDPSWHNWPVLEHAIIDNIVPDFPLINKSFNLSYSGHDL